MKLGMIITQTDPETVFNALRLAHYSLKQGDEVKIFLSGRGVCVFRGNQTSVPVETSPAFRFKTYHSERSDARVL